MACFIEEGSRVFNIPRENELSFVVNREGPNVTLQLINGTAEILGAELIKDKIYTFEPSSSVCLFSFEGCSVKLTISSLQLFTIREDAMIMINVSNHASLEEKRIIAESENTLGPVTLIVGPSDIGKTSLCYFLLNYAARKGRKPLFVNLDVSQSSVSMPGTISVMPVDKQSDINDGFDHQSLSVYHFGHQNPRDHVQLYLTLIKGLGPMIRERMKNDNPNTCSSGIIIDTCGWITEFGYSALTLAACSFEIDNLFVLADYQLFNQLRKDMPESVDVFFLPEQNGVIRRKQSLRAKNRDNRIWEYFYGSGGNLNPSKIEVNFSDISIYAVKSPPGELNIDAETESMCLYINVSRVIFSQRLKQCVLSLSSADKVDENLMLASIIGFVCITGVDMDRKIVTLLSPQPGPLPSKICILGQMKLQNQNINTVKSEI